MNGIAFDKLREANRLVREAAADMEDESVLKEIVESLGKVIDSVFIPAKP